MTVAFYLLVLASVSLNAVAQIFLRKAMLVAAPLPSLDAPVTLLMHLVTNVHIWLGVACYVLSLGVWLAVLSRVQVSVAYPLQSIGYIIAAVSAFALLGEAVPLTRAAGIALICSGVLLVARSA